MAVQVENCVVCRPGPAGGPAGPTRPPRPAPAAAAGPAVRHRPTAGSRPGGDQAGAQVGVVDHQQRRPVQPGRGGAVAVPVVGEPGVPAGHQHLHARFAPEPGLARPAAPGHQQHRPPGRVLAPAGDPIQQSLAAQEWHQPVLRAQQRGRPRTEPAADRPVGRGQADCLLPGQPQIPAGPHRRHLGRHPIVVEPGPETRVGEQPGDRHRGEPILVAGRIDGDHPDQMVVRDHPGAGHPRPWRATLPGGRRCGGHV